LSGEIDTNVEEAFILTGDGEDSGKGDMPGDSFTWFLLQVEAEGGLLELLCSHLL